MIWFPIGCDFFGFSFLIRCSSRCCCWTSDGVFTPGSSSVATAAPLAAMSELGLAMVLGLRGGWPQLNPLWKKIVLPFLFWEALDTISGGGHSADYAC
eukprot:g26707.t1